MEAALAVPNAALVREACEQFDRENGIIEKALADLFSAYPANDNPSHVLLKVVALNSLYSTRVLAVLKLADHISGQGATLDPALAAGSAEAVDSIARIKIGEKDFAFYSFATKYCNWHQPNLFPIYDSRVDKYLWLLKKKGAFCCESFSHHQDLYDYSIFCNIMTAFRGQFGLSSFTFKEIDKFLWSQGESLWVAAEEGAREEASLASPLLAEGEKVNPEAQQPETSIAFADPQVSKEEMKITADADSEFFKRPADDENVKFYFDVVFDDPPDSSDETQKNQTTD